MIELKLSEVSRCKDLPIGHVVYAIGDVSGRPCYVGRTRVAKDRSSTHLLGLTNLRTLPYERGQLLVAFYSRPDVDALIVDGPRSIPSEFSSDEKWATEAEAFLCRKFHPYLNVRLGWPGELVRTRDFLNSLRLGSRIERAGRRVISEWDPPFDQGAIFESYVAGADILALARVAGIEFGDYRPRSEQGVTL